MIKYILPIFLLLNWGLPATAQQKKADGLVRYSDFGAKGDGTSDDMEAIVAAHAFANQHRLKVKADAGASYYIGGKARTAIIQTDTDFGTATFIIDDSGVEDRNTPVFTVSSGLKSFKLENISSLKRNQQKIEVALPRPCLITVTNANVKQYIRFGLNQNNGSPQTDIFIADKNGKIDMNAPIIWDFKQITDITALPIDENLLKITGGTFNTIANKSDSLAYFCRGIFIRMSHVLVDGMKHYI
jgi:hypothetical protein